MGAPGLHIRDVPNLGVTQITAGSNVLLSVATPEFKDAMIAYIRRPA